MLNELPSPVFRIFILLHSLSQSHLRESRGDLARRLGVGRSLLIESLGTLRNLGLISIEHIRSGPHALSIITPKNLGNFKLMPESEERLGLQSAMDHTTISHGAPERPTSAGAAEFKPEGVDDTACMKAISLPSHASKTSPTKPAKLAHTSATKVASKSPLPSFPTGKTIPQRSKIVVPIPPLRFGLGPALRAEAGGSDPEEIKIHLPSGEVMNRFQVRLNACRLSRDDVSHLMSRKPTPQRDFLKSFLEGAAEGIRSAYIPQWCEKWKRGRLSWKETDRSKRGFLGGAETWAQEYIDRGMEVEQFLAACVEMAPKSLRYPTVDYIGGTYLRENIYAWVPPSERKLLDGDRKEATVVYLDDIIDEGVMSALCRDFPLERNWPGLYSKATK